MPFGFLVQVVQELDFLQVVNTILYAAMMDYSNDSSSKFHSSHIHTCFYIFYLAISFISNCKHTFTMFIPIELLILSIMDSSTLR
jgi:hypothetical protein